ncbi:PPE domain-containing protein [Nocardia sp. alder85J]|uniref:PPE domain-containing protein n=1 Tax=Nocardia sp. alder85J TaxID=2862949 RepID=UPI001CD63CF6|nr:PPE domain-containing protein [Nocardia sp. alder85J]MCX4096604.1 PPE domain-containing protein [Nocardia sp. alder85J]
MTAGITGVFWLPRLAEGNSAALETGAHAVPISAAAAAWGTLTGAWVDATATVARVLAELGAGLEGVNGIAALSRLTGFIGWAEQQGALAAAMGAKAASNATAYTVASLAMPSLPEIAAADTARAVAHASGGDLDGSAELAEAAKAAIDLRAAMVMETYEAATTAIVTTPNQFPLPPAIANGAGSADGQDVDGAFQDSASVDPVQAAVAGAQAALSNPGLTGALDQAAQVAGTVVSTGATAAGDVAGGMISAATGAVPGPMLPSASMPPMMMNGLGAAMAQPAAVTRTVSYGGSSVGIGNGAGTLRLPEGWGSGGVIGGGPAAATGTDIALDLEDPQAAARAQAMAGNPLLGYQAQEEESEADRHGPDYLRGEHFADGRDLAPGVIGADPAHGER